MTPPPQSTSQPPNQHSTPRSILIIGAGVFGLSTTLALLSSPHYDHTTITLLDPFLPSLDSSTSTLDSSPDPDPDPPNQHQNPHAASIDSSRIIRADYAIPAYTRLAHTALQHWRAGFGGKGVYKESGLVLTSKAEGGREYVDKARRNAEGVGCRVCVLEGESGYINLDAGFADAAAAMRNVMALVVAKAKHRGGVVFRREKVRTLLSYGDRVLGAILERGQEVRADLTIVAAGAWSGALVDLRGRVEARGQVVAYLPLTPLEKAKLDRVPIRLDLSSGMFVIPPVYHPSTGWELKIARHGYGYANPTPVSPQGEEITTSLPHALFSPIPSEGESACRAFLRQTIPWLAERAFVRTRICWYADTPTGDFLVGWHPRYQGLFLATGGSGHGFKFLPVLGGKVVDAVEGGLEGELGGLWGWREEGGFGGTEDGSRGGVRGMVLGEEWKRGGRSRL